jgi:hypothetical protein
LNIIRGVNASQRALARTMASAFDDELRVTPKS